MPSNRFVAGFVGTPPMNFFDGTIRQDQGGLWFDEGTARVRLPQRIVDRVSAMIDKPIVMGVRPEAVNDEPTGRFEGTDNAIKMTINVTEPLGDKMDLYLATEKHGHVVARIDAHRGVEPETQQLFYLDMERSHFFEPGETGKNLTLSNGA